ncbi:hypothetical protein HCH_07039 [Hahella chejuensis KCTC 2396]|uniref:Uncharacterized protein n=1 Tax=Hahella chejuensis (strain KCTC 2396) TaxID=349521 RepID=Q2S6S0_HAHCH|nr:hypothetical protein [Hahella chejuensis]ABC33654.1 hypothetical protein HCH_07039 [Hahella chejuensis KCTC 2396]
MAEEVFNMEQAGRAHIDAPTFSLNTAYAVLVGDHVAIPVDGGWNLSDIQKLAPNATLFEL